MLLRCDLYFSSKCVIYLSHLAQCIFRYYSTYEYTVCIPSITCFFCCTVSFLTHIIQLLFVLCPFISLYGINTLSYLTKHKAFSPTNVCLPSSGQTSSFQQLSNLLYLLLAVTFTKEHPTMNG